MTDKTPMKKTMWPAVFYEGLSLASSCCECAPSSERPKQIFWLLKLDKNDIILLPIEWYKTLPSAIPSSIFNSWKTIRGPISRGLKLSPAIHLNLSAWQRSGLRPSFVAFLQVIRLDRLRAPHRSHTLTFAFAVEPNTMMPNLVLKNKITYIVKLWKIRNLGFKNCFDTSWHANRLDRNIIMS